MHRTVTRFALLSAFWCLGQLSSVEAEEASNVIPGPSFEEVIALRSVAAPVISPNGGAVAYTVRTVDWKGNRFDTEIWLVRGGGEPFQLTRNPDGSSDSPSWSPDGKWLAFLSDRGAKRQIYVIRADGGEAQPLTQSAEAVSRFKWSPSGRMLAYSSPSKIPEERQKQKELYGEFAVEDMEFSNEELWLVEFQPDPQPGPGERPCIRVNQSREPGVDGGDHEASPRTSCDVLAEPRELVASNDFTIRGFEWSKDGSQIVFEHRQDPLINSYTTADISVVDVATREVRPLVEGPGFDGNPQWSPDSKWILYSSSAGNTTSDYYRNGLLFKVAADGGNPLPLGQSIDEELGDVTWTPTGIYALVFEKTARRIYRIDPETGATEVFASHPRNVWDLDSTPDGENLAIVGQNPTTLPEVFVSSTADWSPIPLTDLSSQLTEWKLGTSEIVSWHSQDGTEIEGVLYKPGDF